MARTEAWLVNKCPMEGACNACTRPSGCQCLQQTCFVLTAMNVDGVIRHLLTLMVTLFILVYRVCLQVVGWLCKKNPKPKCVCLHVCHRARRDATCARCGWDCAAGGYDDDSRPLPEHRAAWEAFTAQIRAGATPPYAGSTLQTKRKGEARKKGGKGR